MSRPDLHGLWWDDPESAPKGVRSPRAIRQVAPPETGWAPVAEYPNLGAVRVIGLDTETKDLQLTERGPGFVRGAAHLVGFSVAVQERAWYFPLRHEYAPQAHLNKPPSAALAWLQAVLNSGVQAIVGANLLYDLEALRAEGVRVPPGVRFYDVQFAEPLLDENRYSYELDALARHYKLGGKSSAQLYQWCAESFGGDPQEAQRGNIWRAPPTLVGPYAQADALLPLQIMSLQKVQLLEQQLGSVFRMECDLIPLLLDMRFRGVRIDVEEAQRTAAWLRARAAEEQQQLGSVDVWSQASLERAFKAAGHEVAYTAAGNPSFTKGWLEQQPHELAKRVLNIRLFEKAANPFVESYLLQNVHNGRVHCQFHPLRSRDYGTVSGRFSSSNPNLQNIPIRHAEIGKRLRGLYIPEEDCKWKRGDYSQIEYRLLVHNGIGAEARKLKARYHEEKGLNFHRVVQAIVKEVSGIELEYKPSKNLNFGLVYGMGKEKLKRTLGVSDDVAERLYAAYTQALPSVLDTNRRYMRLANRDGMIRTLLGRIRRFPWGPDPDNPKLKVRLGTHAGLNAELQGSAADIIKKAMVDCYKAGLFAQDACGIPHLTVHDELDWSQQPGARAQEAFAQCQHQLEHCVELEVPLIVEMSDGPNWGACS